MCDWQDEEIDADDLPQEAWQNFFDADGPREVNDLWFKVASCAEQHSAMTAWFYARYQDPKINLPFSPEEGTYTYDDRGPYFAAATLDHRFGHLAHKEVFDHIITELNKVGDQWASVPEPRDPYEDIPPFEDQTLSEIFDRYSERIEDLRQVFKLRGDESTKKVARHLSYSAAIGCLEAYLWETAVYLVRLNDEQPRRLIASVPELAQVTMTRAKFLQEYGQHEAMVLEYLNRVVWHRWEQVSAVLKGLGLKELPSFRDLQEPLTIRNHIIHRNGRDLKGAQISVGPKKLEDLLYDITNIVSVIQAKALKIAEDEGQLDRDLPWW